MDNPWHNGSADITSSIKFLLCPEKHFSKFSTTKKKKKQKTSLIIKVNSVPLPSVPS